MVDHSAEDNNAKTKRTLTDEEIMSQLILFMLAGTDTTSTALGYVSYNLAMHSEYQEKLIKEIDTVIEKHVIIFFISSKNVPFSFIFQC